MPFCNSCGSEAPAGAKACLACFKELPPTEPEAKPADFTAERKKRMERQGQLAGLIIFAVLAAGFYIGSGATAGYSPSALAEAAPSGSVSVSGFDTDWVDMSDYSAKLRYWFTITNSSSKSRLVSAEVFCYDGSGFEVDSSYVRMRRIDPGESFKVSDTIYMTRETADRVASTKVRIND